MHKKMIKTFVKDHKNIENTKVRNNYGKFTAVVGIISNTVLFVMKLVIGLMLSSISILADAINNLIDSISSIVTLFGFRLSEKPADKEHPFGHARFESISGLLVGIIVVFFGVEFIQASIKRIINPAPVSLSVPMLLLLLLTVGIKFWQYSFNKHVGENIKSNVILATALDSRNDMLMTLLVLFGIIFEYFFNLQIDGYVGLLLALLIIYSGISSMRKTVAELLGQRPSNEVLKSMEDLLISHKDKKILGYHDLIVHQYGHNQYFATVHVEVDANKDLVEAHNIIDNIERDFKEKLKVNMVIHQDPVILDDPIINEYFKRVREIIYKYDDAYSLHDFRLVKHNNEKIIIFDLVVDQAEEKDDVTIKSELKEIINSEYKKDKVKIIIDRNYMSVRR